MNNIKRFTIITRSHLIRGKGGYFNIKKDVECLVNYTDLKMGKLLNEKNKNMKKNFWEIEKDYILKTKIEKNEFLKDFITNYGEIKQAKNNVDDLEKIKNIAFNIISNL